MTTSGARRRHTTWLLTFAAATVAAAVAGAAVAVRDGEPRRVARDVTSAPVATAPTTPAPVTTPASPATTSPQPAASPAVGRDEFVALLPDGRLVAASARNGRVTRTILADAAKPRAARSSYFGSGADLALSPDRRTVFLSVTTEDGKSCGPVLERVDVATGRRRPVGHGTFPDVSPDGRRLVYVGCDHSLVVRDLGTGAERRFPHDHNEYVSKGDYTMPWALDRAVWRADSRMLWVNVHWENSTELRVLDPATDRSTGDAAEVATKHLTYELDRRGADLVHSHSCCYLDEELGNDAIVLRTAAGAERRLALAPNGAGLGAPVAGPAGDLLYERRGRLYRFTVATGASTDLGAATALARDW